MARVASGNPYAEPEVREKPRPQTPEEYPFFTRHPNIYGMVGVAKELVPYARYIDPAERERFNQLAQNEQTRELLFENLRLVAELAGGKVIRAGGKLLQPIVTKAGRYFSKISPRTHKILTGKIGRASPNVGKAFQQAGQLPKEKVLRTTESKQIASAMKRAITDPDKPFITDPQRRIMYDIQETIIEYPEHVKGILRQYNLSPRELADELIHSASHSGRTLKQLSDVRKALLKAFPKDSTLAKSLSKIPEPKQTTFQQIGNLWYKVDRVRRMSMVSQLATASRNAVSQAGYYGLRTVEDAAKGIFKTVGGVSPKEAFGDVAYDIAAIINRMTPSKRKALQGILDKYAKTEAELLTAPIHDISLGGTASRILMFFNRIQENVFRKMAFEARVRSLAKKEGVDFDNIVNASDEQLDKVEGIFRKAIDNALEITFAKTPKVKLPGNITSQQLLSFWNRFPGLTTIQPFPRFWANAIKFLWDFNPTGFLTAAQRAIINKGGKESYEAMARATVGTMMLGMAFEIRNSEWAGDKWYEIRTGRKTSEGEDEFLDLRAFAPFSSYLFIAEAALQSARLKPINLTKYDVAQGVIGINRIAGTGLVFIDYLRGKFGEGDIKNLKRFFGEYLGGFTVAGRTIRDFLSLVNPREAKVGATRTRPITGPAMENIPVETREALGYKIPEAERLEKPGGYKREKPVIRQMTGLTFKGKIGLKQEIDRLGITGIYPQTGDAELDRKILQSINERLQERSTKLLKSTVYKKSSDIRKIIEIKDLISKEKSRVKPRISLEHYDSEIKNLETHKNKKEFLFRLVKKNKINKAVFYTLMNRNKIQFNMEERRDILALFKR